MELLSSNKPFFLILTARPNSGKSYLIQYLMLLNNEEYSKNPFQYGLCLTNTSFNGQYNKFIPDEFIHSTLDLNLIDNLMNIQKTQIETNGSAQRAFLILDDLLSQKAFSSQTFLSSLYTVYTAQSLTANTNLTFTQWTTKYLDKNKLIAKVVASPLQIPFLSSFFFPTFNILSQLRPSKNFFPFINLQTSKTERKKRGISTVLKVMLPFTPAIGAASFVVKTIIDS